MMKSYAVDLIDKITQGLLYFFLLHIFRILNYDILNIKPDMNKKEEHFTKYSINTPIIVIQIIPNNIFFNS